MERWIIVLVAVLAPVFSTQADDNLKRARQEFKEATVLYKNGEYAAAAEKFKVCYKLQPTYKILYNIGQSEAAAKRYGLSLQAFEKYLADGGDDVPESRQEEVRAEIKRLRDMIGFFEITAPKNAVIFIDGVERGTYPTVKRIPVAATVVHEVKAKYEDGSETPTKQFSVTGGDSVSVTLLEEAKKEVFPLGPSGEPETSNTKMTKDSEASPLSTDSRVKEKKLFVLGLAV